MNNQKTTWIIIFISIMIFFSSHAIAGELSEKKVVVISGTSKENAARIGYYSLVYNGIDEGFKTAGIQPIYQWIKLGELPTDDAKEAAGKVAIANAMKQEPDLIITLNDDALKFVAAKINDIPVVFAFIFGTPSIKGMPKNNVTGVLRASYAVDMWKLAKKIFPKADTVGLISTNTVSMAGTRKGLFKRAPILKKASGVEFKEMYLVDTFDEWKKAVETFPYDFIYLADTSRIKDGDKILTRDEITAWTVKNAKVPVIAAAEDSVKAGALFAIVTSESGIGMTAAEVALRILNGEPPPQVYPKSEKGKLVFNLKTAHDKKIEIPYELLSSSDKVYE